MIFVDICEKVRRRVGSAGTITTIEDQVGRLALIIDYVVQANDDIQRAYFNWKFLWNPWQQTLTVDATYTPPSGVGMFNIDAFWMDKGTEDAIKLQYLDYDDYRENYEPGYLDPGFPAFVTLRPDGLVQVVPSPDSDHVGSTLDAEYWRSPVPLINNDDVSIIPPDYHEAIVCKARMMFFEFIGDTGRYMVAQADYARIFKELRSHCLPGNEEEGKSKASSQVIEII
jgi:hypothetical protein